MHHRRWLAALWAAVALASSGVDAIALRDRCLLKQDGVRTDCPCENTSTEERAILTAVPGARISGLL